VRVTGEVSANQTHSLKKFFKLPRKGNIWNFMSSLAQQISAAGLADRIFCERQLGASYLKVLEKILALPLQCPPTL